MDEIAFFVGLFGLILGSFLNVVIHRIPVMMQRDLLMMRVGFHDEKTLPVTYNLIWPASHCPSCLHTIRPLQNIPLLSYLALRGRCSECGGHISFRYPLVELITTGISLWVYFHFGLSFDGFAALILGYGLICMTFIDIEHQLLPDCITIPFIWLGLIFSLFSVFAGCQSAIIGAVSGYLSLWLVFYVFRLFTGKEGMGFGDFKLLALLGSWLGWEFLPQIILLSSLTGIITAILLIFFNKHQLDAPLPFGPFLAFAGWLTLMLGDGFLSVFF